jgi:tRNA(fMet)-specific endonuclease VapC
MNGKLLLDTNIVIGLLSGDQRIIGNMQERSGTSIPVFVLGELFFGAYKSHNINKNLENIKEVLSVIPVINCNEETSKIYGSLKNSLKTKEKPIPENDIWIAATALQFNMTLVTRDKHIYNIDGINIEEW